MASQSDQDYLFKILLVGDACTGKSQLILRFNDDSFQEEYLTTIGVDFRSRTIEIYNQQVKLQIWDTAGQERFKTITSSYYKGSHAILIVFDIANQESFDNLSKHLEKIQEYSQENVKVVIVGNKSDLLANRTVQYSEAKNFADSKNLPYFEVSAKTGEGINNVFESVSKMLINSKEGKNTEPQQNGEVGNIQKGESNSIYNNLY